jgi:hypothetical protein
MRGSADDSGGSDPDPDRIFWAELHSLYEAAGSPTRDRLVRAAKLWHPPARLTEQTLSDWLSGNTVPSDRATVLALIDHLKQLARKENAGFVARPVNWPKLHAAAKAARREHRRKAADPDGKGTYRVTDVPGRLIGVKPAIRVDYPRRLADIPPYVTRDYDEELRAAVRVASVESRLILLVGPSASGKTRSAYEAVLAEVPGFPMVIPQSGAELEKMLEDQPIMEPSVVWLDDFQRFFGKPDGVTFDAIFEILNGDHPVVAVGTVWPEWYDALTKDPYRSGGDDVAFGVLYQAVLQRGDKPKSMPRRRVGDDITLDRYEHARRVIDGLAQEVSVDPAFSRAEKRRAGEAARDDRRLRVALDDPDDFGVTQVLAGAPRLVKHWESQSQEHVFGVAAITVAIDIRRIGVESPIPFDVILAAVPAYVSEHRMALAPPDWRVEALSYACSDLGGTSALILTADDSGEPYAASAADFLAHHGSRRRGAEPVSDLLWKVAADRAWPPNDLRRLAASARLALRPRMAEMLLRRTEDKDAGYTKALLGQLYLEQSRLREARAAYEQAVRAGNLAAYKVLTGWIEPAQCGALLAEATEQVRARVRRSDASTARTLIAYLLRAGRHTEAIAELRKLAEEGTTVVRRQCATQMAACGDAEAAIDEFHALAREGHVDCWRHSGIALWKAGRHAEADRDFRRGIAAGDEKARQWYVETLTGSHRYDDAIALCQSLLSLARILRVAGRIDRAEHFYSQAADGGDASALMELARLHASRARYAEAVGLLQTLPAANSAALLLRANYAERASGQPDDGVRVLQEAIDAGHTWAYLPLARVYARWGRRREAAEAYRAAFALGNREASLPLASLLEGDKQFPAAEDVWLDAVRLGVSSARRGFAQFLIRRGRVGEALDELRAAALSCDPGARQMLVRTEFVKSN